MNGIRFAQPGDEAGLKALFGTCFSDTEYDINCFFNTVYSPENTVVYVSDGEICSELFMIDATIYSCEDAYRALYLYGICTSESFRGRGFASELISFAREAAVDRGVCALALVPAEEGLFSYYGRLGFYPALTALHAEFFEESHNTVPEFRTFVPDIREILDIRRSDAGKRADLIFCENMLKYMTDSSREGIGALAARSDSGEAAYVLFEYSDAEIHVTEAFGSKELFRGLKEAIQSSHPQKRLLPAEFAQCGKYTGMLMPISEAAQHFSDITAGQPY